MKTQKYVVTVALLAGLGTACGGSNNGKLDRHVSQAHLAPMSAAERSGEAEAQREFFLSEWQVAFTESQLRTAKLDVDIAKNKLASVKLDVKNAKLKRAAAEESNDQKAIADTQQAEKVAALQIEVHKLSIERAKQSKRYLEKRLTHEQRSLRSREANVELARAKSLEGAGIKPPNFDRNKYKAQHSERVASEKAAKASVTTEKTKLDAVDTQLLAAQNAVASAEGNPVLLKVPEASKPMEPLEGDKPPKKAPEAEETEPAEETTGTSTEEGTATEPATKTAPVGKAVEPAPNVNQAPPVKEPTP